MLISHIRLKNWRNFKDIEVPLKPRMFLVGPNACGKSNFLDAIRFLRDLVKPGGGLQQAVTERGGLSKIRCLAARQAPDVEIEIHLSGSPDSPVSWKYLIGIRQQTRGNRLPLLSYEKVYQGETLVLERPDKDDQADDLRLTQTHLEQINANREFREIAEFLNQIQYLHLVPQLLRNPKAYEGPGIPDDPHGRNFLERVARTPEKTRESRLRRIEKALSRAVPQLQELTEVKDESGIPHLEAIYKHWRPKGARQREDQFSDGTLRLIGLLWSLLEGKTVLLLEEPELSLHNAIVSLLPSIIYRMLRMKKKQQQIFISTHSPELLSDAGIDGGEVLLLTPSLEGTEIHVASQIDEIRMLLTSGLSIADAVLPHTVPQDAQQLMLEFMDE